MGNEVIPNTNTPVKVPRKRGLSTTVANKVVAKTNPSVQVQKKPSLPSDVAKKLISNTNTPVKAPIKPKPSIGAIKKAVIKKNPSVKVQEKPKPSNDIQKKPTTKTNTPIKAPKYKIVGNRSTDPTIKKIIPKEFLPTKRMATILGLIFLAVIILALIQIPYGGLLKGNLEIKVGYPLPFLDFGAEISGTLPAKPLNLTIDLIIYLMLSYIIDVLITLMLNTNTAKIRKKQGKGAKVYED
jgi:hypothetical protein